jgi:hypothetical protein
MKIVAVFDAVATAIAFEAMETGSATEIKKVAAP